MFVDSRIIPNNEKFKMNPIPEWNVCLYK